MKRRIVITGASSAIGQAICRRVLQPADEAAESTALRRPGTLEDVAAAVAFLCGGDASFISGRTIGVDGGFRSGV